MAFGCVLFVSDSAVSITSADSTPVSAPNVSADAASTNHAPENPENKQTRKEIVMAAFDLAAKGDADALDQMMSKYDYLAIATHPEVTVTKVELIVCGYIYVCE